VTIVGTYRFNSGVATGSFLTFTPAVSNNTNPTGSIPSALVQPTQNRIGVLAASTIAAVTRNTIDVSTPGNMGTTGITITEAAAGTWRPGQVVGVCFPDGPTAAADEDTFRTSTGFFPWATVTTGDIKLAGAVTTLKGTLSAADVLMADSETTVAEDTANQCVYWTIYSASTTASTLTINSGNVAGTAADATKGPLVLANGRTGVAAAAVVGGAAYGSALVLGTAIVFNRVDDLYFSVTTSTLPTVATPGEAQAVADVTIAEPAAGTFDVASFTLTLTDQAGTASTAATLSASLGSDAPVVTQTNADSNIVWDYSVSGSVVTVNVRTASSGTGKAATFKISNLKVNTIAVKSNGVNTSSSDLFVRVTGNALYGQSFLKQVGNVKNVATSTADALLELAKAIGTGNSANEATDAALEAIDAANAAVDAANLAAEAADAATVAAEEARDAADAATASVEALATEVATLVAALKAQITTLANTVAKIAKKVKA